MLFTTSWSLLYRTSLQWLLTQIAPFDVCVASLRRMLLAQVTSKGFLFVQNIMLNRFKTYFLFRINASQWDALIDAYFWSEAVFPLQSLLKPC